MLKDVHFECPSLALNATYFDGWKSVADGCAYPKCAIGNAFIPDLQGRFFATENFFYTSDVCFV